MALAVPRVPTKIENNVAVIRGSRMPRIVRERSPDRHGPWSKPLSTVSRVRVRRGGGGRRPRDGRPRRSRCARPGPRAIVRTAEVSAGRRARRTSDQCDAHSAVMATTPHARQRNSLPESSNQIASVSSANANAARPLATALAMPAPAYGSAGISCAAWPRTTSRRTGSTSRGTRATSRCCRSPTATRSCSRPATCPTIRSGPTPTRA